MDVILKAVIDSDIAAGAKNCVIEKLIPVAQPISKQECCSLLQVCWDMALTHDGDMIPVKVVQVYAAWAQQNVDALYDFFAPSLLFSPLRDDPPRNVIRFLELLSHSLLLLRGRDTFPQLCRMMQSGCICLLRKCNSLSVLLALCALLRDLPECIPTKELVGTLCAVQVRTLAAVSTSEFPVRLLVKDAVSIANFLQCMWVCNETSLTKTLKAIHFHLCNDEAECSPVLAALIEHMPGDLAETVTRTMVEETSTDQTLILAVGRMIEWLCWPRAVQVDVWLLAVFNSLARSKKFLVLKTVFFDKIKEVFRWLFLLPTQRSALRIFSYMLLSYQKSPCLFLKVAPDIPALVSSIKKQAESTDHHGILGCLSKTLHAVMQMFPGYPDLYLPILDELQETTPPMLEELQQLIHVHKWTEDKSHRYKHKTGTPGNDHDIGLLCSETGMTGLANLGNTCYVNSVIQALYMTDRLRFGILRAKTTPCETLTKKLQEVFAYLALSQRPAYSPASFVQASRPPWFECGEQQDCSEFLRYLLDNIHESGKALSCSGDLRHETFPSSRNGRNTSLVQNVFGGIMEITYKCLRCGTVSTHEDNFLDLHLAFPEITCQSESLMKTPVNRSRTLKTQNTAEENGQTCSSTTITLNCLINSYFQAEILEGNNQYHCNTCQSLQNGERVVTVTYPPEHLILTLLRFSYNTTSGARGKILCHVQCPTDMFLPANFNGKKFVTYALYAAIVHSGTSAESGHYYTYGRSSEFSVCSHLNNVSEPNSDRNWHLFNDGRVSFSSYDSLVASSRRFPRDTVYVLFYKKVSSEENLVSPLPFDCKVSICDISPELSTAISMDNAKYLQEHEAEIQKRKRSSKQINSFDRDQDFEGPGPPMGGCGGGLGGLDQPFNRFVY